MNVIDSPAQILSQLPYGKEVTYTGDMLSLLRGLYGSSSNWECAEQQDALEAVMKLESDIIVAIGAGVGKSAIALLPTIYEDGYTVIVLGLRSLMEDRLQKLALPFERYTGANHGDLAGNHNLILVSADCIQDAKWKGRLGMLNQQRPVLRIIVDEVHQYLTEVQFRSKAFGTPFGARSVPCQLVLMSSSLPPSSIPHLTDIFGLRNPIVFRTPALSRHIIFRFHELTSQLSPREKVILKYIKTWEAGALANDKDRYLIFVTCWEDGKDLSELLGCPFYHGSKTVGGFSDRERKDMVDGWRNGKTRHGILVATSALLSAGLDYPSVRLAFFVNLPADMITFYQQSHQVACDGHAGSCIVLTKPGPVRKLKNPDPILDRMRGVKEMMRFGPTKCLRYQLSNFLNGEGLDCYDIWNDHEPCGVCHECKFDIFFSLVG